MSTIHRKVAFFATIALLFYAQLQARWSVGSYMYFQTDYACFQAVDGKTFVEFYTHVDYENLQFIKMGEGFVASYELDVMLYKDGDFFRDRTFIDTVRVRDYKSIDSSQKIRLSVQGFIVEPGEYDLKVVVRDQETGKTSRRERTITVPEFSSTQLNISDIQFARKIEIIDDKDNAFIKNSRFVEPNVPRNYGFFAYQMFIYYEIYGLQPDEEHEDDYIAVNYNIRTLDGELVHSVQKRTAKPGSSCVHSVLLPISNLKSGKYRLELVVTDPATHTEVTRSKKFNIGWESLSLQENSYKELLTQLSYIASEQEIATLEKLPEEKHRTGLLSFWKSRDPSLETTENELMIEFYRRVAYANKHYLNATQRGWKSDQGRVYIQNGHPDKMHRKFSALDGKLYEIWQYKTSQRKFVFVDEHGDGEFRLVPGNGLASY